MGLKEMLNYDILMDHLVNCPAKYGQWSTCLSGWLVQTTMACARKYHPNFLDVVTRTNATFCIFW